jgi:hypothetical protein
MTSHLSDHLHRFGLAILLTLGVAVWHQPFFAASPLGSTAQNSTESQQLIETILHIAASASRN